MDLKARLSQLSKMQLKDAIATPKGKGVAAGLVLVILLLVVLVIVTFAVPKPQDLAVKPVAKLPVQQAAVPAVAAEPSTGTATSTDTTYAAGPDTALVDGAYDFHDYRDPFSPLVETTSTTGASTISAVTNSPASTSTPAGVAVIPQVLSLQGISNSGGTKVASVLYQGTAYQVRTGDQVGASPFQIIEVGDTSISLLYGDDRLTLQLGDEIVK